MDKIYAQIDNEVIELKGEALDELLKLREELNLQAEADKQKFLDAQKKQTEVIAKLELLGLSIDDLIALGLTILPKENETLA